MLDLAYQATLKEETADDSSRVILVAPAPRELPDDGVLKYVTVTSVYDMKDVQERSVALFAQADLPVLKCISENEKLFGCKLMYLAGVPAAEYTAEFDGVVWAAERVSYSALTADLALARQIHEGLEAQNMTTYDVERSRVERSNGSVKEHSKFALATGDDDDVAAE